jgi:tetratricopeptide (TPR) repeat protein
VSLPASEDPTPDTPAVPELPAKLLDVGAADSFSGPLPPPHSAFVQDLPRTESRSPGDTPFADSPPAGVDAYVDSFDRAWQEGQTPEVDDFLPSGDHPLKRRILEMLLLADLEHRLEAGQAARVEAYLQRYPELAADASLVIDLLMWERVVRRRKEPNLSLGEYAQRFPHLQADLRERLAAPLTTPVVGPVAPLLAIPGYQILGELGKGGMGVVYLARQVQLNRTVALKMIRSGEHAGADERMRFLTEAEVIAAIGHPGIVQIHEFGTHEDCPWFALEYCPGGSLAHKINRTPLPPGEAASLVSQIAQAVQAAHEKGIIHRDLKPANVLMTAAGEPRVTDFGLAKRVEGDSGLTQTGAILGTPSYMAPEQAQGMKTIGPAADVYALGAILYECLVGRPPFRAATTFDTIIQVISDEPVPPQQLNALVPADLETICLKCLQKEPQRRYTSAAALADDLRRFLQREPILARPVAAWERAWKWSRRRPMAAALVAALLLLVVSSSVGGLFFGLFKAQQTATLQERAKRQQERTERQRRADELFGKGRDAEANGLLALERKQEQKAREQLEAADRSFASALSELGEGEESQDQRDQITTRQEWIRKELDHLRLRQQMGPRIDRLRRDRDEILFHEVSPTGLDQADNLTQVLQRSAKAILPFGVTPECSPAQVVQALQRERGLFASAQEMREVAENCYEVLLAWAEAEVQSSLLPGRPLDQRKPAAQQALRRLDVARGLARANGLVTPKAYYLRRARYHAQAGQPKEAATAQALADAMQPSTALDFFLAALEHYRQHQLDLAARECGLALRARAGHFWARYLQALCYVKGGNWTAARDGLTACLSQQSRFLWALLLRGTVQAELASRHAKEKKAELAKADFAAAAPDFAQALELAQDPLARSVALTNRSVLWERQQRWDDAAADLHEAMWLRPNDHLAYVNAAELSRQRGDRQTAVAALDLALARRPADATLYYTRARDHLALGNTAAATQDLERTILLLTKGGDAKRLASAYVELGVLKDRAGAYRAALAAFASALVVLPDYPPAYRQQDDTLRKLEQYHDAGKALDRYLAHGKPDAKVYLARGLIHRRLGEHQAAVKSFSRSLLLHENADALTERGWAHLQLKSPSLALEDFDAALALRPKHPLSLCGRGQALALLGRVAEAIRAGEEALRLKESGEEEFLVALVYARVANFLALTQRQRGRERPGARYEDQAAELLCRALGRISPKEWASWWRKRIETQPALAAIRRHPKVARLIVGLEK